MPSESLSTLFDSAHPALALFAAGGALIGLALWLAGSRFSRSLVTLFTVSLGASVGLHLPGWLHLPVTTWSTAIGGALILGISGYALHRAWVGFALAFILSLGAAAATWLMCAATAVSALPQPAAGAFLWDYPAQAWTTLPDDFRHITPFACGSAAAAGLLCSIFFYRFATYLLYSSLGLSLLLGLGGLAMAFSRPQMLCIIPTHRASQLLALTCLLLFGMLVQWRLSPCPAASADSGEPCASPDDE